MSSVEVSQSAEKLPNEATVVSDKFLNNEKHGFIRTIGHVLRTASTEFLTYLGAPLVPAGLVVAGVTIFGHDILKNDTIRRFAEQNPDQFRKIGPAGVNSAANDAVNLLTGAGIVISDSPVLIF